MLSFGMLPPEVNSTRMYAGPGSGPLMAAAAAWDSLTWQLDSFATGCASVIAELQDEAWSGGASQAMVAAAKPYIAWATATATLTEQVAGQARAAAGAYETAFAATVPPAAVTANRIQLATLVATNFFGQNTPAIAATEATYAEMWAQDAAAMYGYAAAASAAAQLTPFSEPPPTTNTAAQSAQIATQAQSVANSQASLSQLISAVPQQLNAFATAEAPNPLASSILTGVDGFNTITRPLVLGFQAMRTFGYIGRYVLALIESQGGSAAQVPSAVTAGAVEPAAAGARGAVLASMGETAPVGKLSVPASWPTSAPATGAADPAPALPPQRDPSQGMPRPSARLRGGAPPTGLGPMQGLAQRRTGYPVFRMRDRRYRMPRPAVGG